MAGLVPAIPIMWHGRATLIGVAGASPAMTAVLFKRPGQAGRLPCQAARSRTKRPSFRSLSWVHFMVNGATTPAHAREYIKAERPQQRAYSQAVITTGGTTVWLAGQMATVDDAGKSLANDLDGQVRQVFKLLNATLEKAGGKLADMVQMTVFITDVRYGDRLTQIRREIFGDNFPGSALITITALANPDAKVEIQGFAVIGAK
jgi:2-iminobutanoate/2-iminopropanoate deaminase